MYCLSCNYDLRNLTEHRCPECGCEFDPADESTFHVPSSRMSPIALVCLFFFTVVVCAIVIPLVLWVLTLFSH